METEGVCGRGHRRHHHSYSEVRLLWHQLLWQRQILLSLRVVAINGYCDTSLALSQYPCFTVQHSFSPSGGDVIHNHWDNNRSSSLSSCFILILLWCVITKLERWPMTHGPCPSFPAVAAAADSYHMALLEQTTFLLFLVLVLGVVFVDTWSVDSWQVPAQR